MEFRFRPDNLIKVEAEIAAIHTAQETVDYSEPSEADKKLIERIYQFDADMEKAAALSLSDKEVCSIAGYIPHNYYGLDENKLFDVLKYRMNTSSGRVLYDQWQENFNNSECNEFMKTLASSNDSFIQVLEENHISSRTFLKILDSRSIPLSYVEELTGKHFQDGGDLDDKLSHFGVQDQSLLNIECKRALLTFCGKSDYLNCSEENIMDIIRDYDLYMLKKFLINFMSKMNLQELEGYPDLAAYLRSLIGHKKSRTFTAFFSGDDPETVQKYLDWINIYKIDTYFGNDDRSLFWKQYRFENVILYPISSVVIMEMEEYIAVEFLGAEKDNVYICTKDVFRDNFYQKLEAVDNSELRMFFKAHKDLCLDCKSHSIRWQSHVGNLLSRKQIAQKLSR